MPGPATPTFTVPPPDVNSTFTFVAAVIPTRQFTALLVRHTAETVCHPAKLDPPPAAGVRFTSVPAGKFAVQVPLVVVPASMQLIPAGALVIVPPPV